MPRLKLTEDVIAYFGLMPGEEADLCQECFELEFSEDFATTEKEESYDDLPEFQCIWCGLTLTGIDD